MPNRRQNPQVFVILLIGSSICHSPGICNRRALNKGLRGPAVFGSAKRWVSHETLDNIDKQVYYVASIPGPSWVWDHGEPVNKERTWVL
jgi:hypothetical protein